MLAGLVLALISVLIFGRLYYIFLTFLPISVCLFARLCGGRSSRLTLVYALLLSVVGVYLTSAAVIAADAVRTNSLPSHVFFQLWGIVLFNVPKYGGEVLGSIFGDVFDVLFIAAYLAIGILISWELIIKTAAAKPEEDEYELVYEDELEPGDEVIPDRRRR